MTKYKPNEQRPLSEVMNERKANYQAMFSQALDKIYSGQNLDQIQAYEVMISRFYESARTGNNLETVLGSLSGQIQIQKTRESTSTERTKIPYQSYREQRDSGKTHQEIAKTGYIPNAYAGAYKLRHENKKAKKVLKTIKTDEEKPVKRTGKVKKKRTVKGKACSFQEYKDALIRGLTHDQVVEQYGGSKRTYHSYSMAVENKARHERERNKTKLTREQYDQEMDQGTNNEQLLDKYRTSSHQLRGYKIHHEMKKTLMAAEEILRRQTEGNSGNLENRSE
jgi:hypothetical protein